MANACEVCGQETNGSHFGVKSCRACAAFFRRYADSKFANSKCLKKAESAESCFCRPCRLRKCFKVGMVTKNFQYNRDAIEPYQPVSPTIPYSVAIFSGRAEFLNFSDPSKSKAKTFVDVHRLISEASRLLDYSYESPLIADSQLKKLNFGSNHLQLDVRYIQSQSIYEQDIIDSLVKLDPTEVELTYLFAQSCFEYAGKRFQGEILKITDNFQQVLSNDLHNYYVKDQKNLRYIQRLTELMKVNNLVQKSIWESRPQRDLNRVFNIVIIGVSHPEMFEDSEFY